MEWLWGIEMHATEITVVIAACLMYTESRLCMCIDTAWCTRNAVRPCVLVVTSVAISAFRDTSPLSSLRSFSPRIVATESKLLMPFSWVCESLPVSQCCLMMGTWEFTSQPVLSNDVHVKNRLCACARRVAPDNCSFCRWIIHNKCFCRSS